MQAWEYTVLTLGIWADTPGSGWHLADREALLAELGSAGWELVALVPLELSTSAEDVGTTHERWVFKRPMAPDGAFTATTQATAEQEQIMERDPADPPRLSSMKEISNPRRDEDDQ